jgi:hypothetical protein
MAGRLLNNSVGACVAAAGRLVKTDNGYRLAGA